MPFFKSVYVYEDAFDFPTTIRILKNINSQELHTLKKDTPLSEIPDQKASNLVLAVKKTPFFHKCPGTKNYICCGYYVLESGFNCPFDCSYCFLKFYLTNQNFFHYVNTNALFDELKNINDQLSDQLPLRVGTGEFTDSLALDPVTEFSSEIINNFSQLDHLIFEFKTKSKQVSQLLKTGHVPENIVISWSMNPPNIIREQEHYAASLEERLSAAKEVQDKGFKLGLHFDPIFYYDQWEQDYQKLIETIFSVINPQRVAWISMGIFRTHPALIDQIMKKDPLNKIIFNEFVLGKDKKTRLAVGLRIKIFKKMLAFFKQIDPELFVYLCMEGKFVWEQVFGFAPKSVQDFESKFIHRFREI